MKLVLEQLLWCQGTHVAFIDSVMFSYFIVLIELAFGMKTVTLEVIQPSTGPVCPGQEVILTCTVVQTAGTSEVFLSWNYAGLNMTAKITYDNSDPQSGPHILLSLLLSTLTAQ